MNTKQIDVFLTVCETLSFSKTARRCFCSQSGVSQQIQSLEEEIGARLFSRTRRGVEKTRAGELLESRFRLYQREMAETVNEAKALERAAHYELRVALPFVPDEPWLPVVQKLLHEMPGLSVFETRCFAKQAWDALAAGYCDIAYVFADPAKIAGLGYEVAFVRKMPRFVVLPQGHHFAGYDTIERRELDGEQILYEDRETYPSFFSEVMRTWDYELEPSSAITNILLGNGIAIFQETTVISLIEQNRLVRIPLSGEGSRIQFCAVWKKGGKKDDLIRDFLRRQHENDLRQFGEDHPKEVKLSI